MNELQITELNGQRVLTTQQIAEGYGTKTRTIIDNFGNNKSRFMEGNYVFYGGSRISENALSSKETVGQRWNRGLAD
ncbi:ORF6N domain-containing protein [Lactococcus lactis subsp. lactis]|uniref:ORF6N domain-containing protein n=1 Tax=Lactococcus lactis TaxID=1358 RepID=UPI00311E1167